MIFEKNLIEKKPMKVDIRFASVYPNVYRTAMSSLGYQIIYGLVNDREDSWCERIVYPNTRSIESNSPLRDFDIISFSLQYEQDYFNMLEILKKSDIPIKREDRVGLNKNISLNKTSINENKVWKHNNKYPLVIAGGPCATANPLPISDFIDVFIIGEAEAVLNNFLDLYKKLNTPKEEIEAFLDIDGVYISSLNNNVKKTIVSNMDDAYHVTNPIMVETDDKELLPVFGNSILLNVSRGCARGCRFCMSGYLYRPLRETSINKLFNVAEEARKNTGLNKVSLIGAAVSDYSKIDELTNGLMERSFQISTPSLRIESITKETLYAMKESGSKTITIAPESIYSLRKSINKDIADDKIFEVVKNSIDLNLNLKLYFLIGLPNETQEDIIELANFIKSINKMTESKKSSIKFSVNPLIPKPHTPLQWEKYDIKDIKNKIKYLKSNLKGIAIKFDSAKMGLIQHILSCRGSEIGTLIENSLKSKINLNEWKEYENSYNIGDDLPWGNIDIGLNSNFLKKERKNILNEKSTPWCEKEGCYNCGPCENI